MATISPFQAPRLSTHFTSFCMYFLKNPFQQHETFCPISDQSTSYTHPRACTVLEHTLTQQKDGGHTVLEHSVHTQAHSTQANTQSLTTRHLEKNTLWHATKNTLHQDTLTRVACHTQTWLNSFPPSMWHVTQRADLDPKNSPQKALTLPSPESPKNPLFSLQAAVLRALLSFLALECGAKVLHSAVPQEGPAVS